MKRPISLVLIGLAFVASMGPQAHSQYYYPYGTGYGGYGFGGFGGTAGGDILRGYGAFAEAEGVYDIDNAMAASINTNTVMRLNQYLYNSHLEAQRRYNAYETRKLNLDKAHYEARQARIRENPTPEYIDSGNALNAVIEQLTNPKYTSGSGLRLASDVIPAKVIKELPFRDETDAITLSLDSMTDANSWPAVLRIEELRPEREAYQKAVDDALAEDKDGGTLKPETIARVRDAVARLYKKTEAVIPKNKQPDHNEAMNYLKGLAGLSRMLERPNFEAILSELEKIENTTVGNLIAFMHSYNLRFAAPQTANQRAAYRTLYPIIASARDKVIGRSNTGAAPNDGNVESPPPAPTESPTAVFHGMNPTHLHPRSTPAKP
jgi:hypothetical protein